MLKKYFIIFLINILLIPSLVLADSYKITEEDYGEYHRINIEFENIYLKNKNIYKGDLNDNGKIDLADIIILLKKYLGIEETSVEEIRYIDMDDDGKIGLSDIIGLLKIYLLGEEMQLVKDNYYFDYDFISFKNYNGKTINNKEELKNYLYYGLNSGKDSYIGICDEVYENCIQDLLDIVYNTNFIGDVNNFVHPFNKLAFMSLNYSYYDNEFTVNITHEYSEDEINEIEAYVDNKIKTLITDDMTDREKIKIIHDDIINNTKYDILKIDDIYDETYKSQNAYGVFFQGYGICSGYTDAMAIYLYELGIKSYEINGLDHIWNLIKLDDNWYHLDATWDDPISDVGDYLIYDYFLIDSNKLHELDKSPSHEFNKEVYLEAN